MLQANTNDAHDLRWVIPTAEKGDYGTYNTILHAGNYNTYVPKLDGTGAYGNWDIKATTATLADYATNIQNNTYPSALKIESSSTQVLKLNNKGTGSSTEIVFQKGGTDQAILSAAGSDLKVTKPDYTGSYIILHANNYTDYAAPKSHASTATTYGASSASNYGHAMASSTTPKANGTAAVGSETAKFARGDHVHPLQTTVSGNAGTATKLATARTISLTGDVTGSASFDGSNNISITTAVANNSHTHNSLYWGDTIACTVFGDTENGYGIQIGKNSSGCEFNIYRKNKNNNVAIWVNGGTNNGAIYTTGYKPTPADIGAAPASHTHSYLPLSGGTVTGTLGFGNYKDTSTLPGSGFKIWDLRDITPQATIFGDCQGGFYFDQVQGQWYSVMHMKGWTGGYASWEIAGNASTALNSNVYVRNMLGTSVSDWYKLFHSGNLSFSLSGTTLTITTS